MLVMDQKKIVCLLDKMRAVKYIQIHDNQMHYQSIRGRNIHQLGYDDFKNDDAVDDYYNNDDVAINDDLVDDYNNNNDDAINDDDYYVVDDFNDDDFEKKDDDAINDDIVVDDLKEYDFENEYDDAVDDYNEDDDFVMFK